MRTALIFRERLLAPSETFILEQAKALRRYRPILTGLRRTEPCLNHSLFEILLSGGSGTLDKVAANVYRRFPIGAAFFRQLSTVAPSIIHAHFAIDAVQAVPIAQKLNLPLVVSLHGFDVTSSDAALRKSFSGRHYLANRHLLFSEAATFLCVSRSIRDAALHAGFPADKLRVHYTGIDCERFRPSCSPRDPKLILFVGRLVEKKGCEYLLRAMALVQAEDPEARLEIIGDGPLRSQLEALAARLSVQVRFLGVQKPAEVLQSMSRSRILCNPSVTAASGDVEGFGMVFAEAQAVGTPIVSFEHAGIPEAVNNGETGLLCPEKDVSSLADSLLTFLKDDSFWSSASVSAGRWVREHFDIAKQSRKLELIYDECIERHPHRVSRRSHLYAGVGTKDIPLYVSQVSGSSLREPLGS